jgi:hypothetical protein
VDDLLPLLATSALGFNCITSWARALALGFKPRLANVLSSKHGALAQSSAVYSYSNAPEWSSRSKKNCILLHQRRDSSAAPLSPYRWMEKDAVFCIPYISTHSRANGEAAEAWT